jgi:hypothetical protein
MKIFRRMEFQLYPFFVVDSRWNWMVRFTDRELYYRQRKTDTNGIWGYVCRQNVLILYAKEERSTLCQGIDPRFTCLSARKMVTVLTELPWHQLLCYFLCFKGKMVTLLRKYHARGRVCVLPHFTRRTIWPTFTKFCVSVLPMPAASWFLTITIGNNSTIELVRRAGRWCLFL